MKLSLASLYYFCALSPLSFASALLEEDVGLFDFSIKTSGHGSVKYASPFGGETVITSDSAATSHTLDALSPSTSCYVSSRFVDSGEIKWRRNVCSGGNYHVVATLKDTMYTMDQVGIVRAWELDTGALLWDAMTAPTTKPRIWTMESGENSSVVAAVSGEYLNLIDVFSGKVVSTMSSKDLSKLAGKTGVEEAHWLLGLPNDDKGMMQILAGLIDTDMVATTSKLSVIQLKSTAENGISISKEVGLNLRKASFSVSSLQVVKSDSLWQAVALSPDGTKMIQMSPQSSQSVEISELHPSWKSMQAILPPSETNMMRILGKNKDDSVTQAMFFWDNKDWKQWDSNSEDTNFVATAFCPTSGILATLSNQDPRIQLWQKDERASIRGDEVALDRTSLSDFTVLRCDTASFSLLLTTSSGSVTQISLSVSDGRATTEIGWEAEDGLGSIDSALILDSSHLHLEDLSKSDETLASQRLLFSSRVASQWESMVGTLNSISSTANNESNTDRRYQSFGFVKTVVLLSESVDRLWGVLTHGKEKGSPQWKIDLPKNAEWHKIVHGTVNSNKATHGINGGTHTNDVMAISSLDNKLYWTCFSGTNGAIHKSSSIEVSSPILQVVPFVGGDICKQRALLIHDDHSVSVVPDDKVSKELVKDLVGAIKNGLYTHFVDKESARLETLQITSGNEGVASRLVGQISFPGERLIDLTYPQRNEVVKSPCTVLGDESLLLKYINPHMALMITYRDSIEADPFALSLKAKGKTKRKPVGATKVNEPAPIIEEEPNLFINIVDTVSGRILHRLSHANAAPTEISSLISENWIFYTFVNKKTRKTELGVITLHEGMVHKKGLTAFTSPDQASSFSSLDARESQPMVLAATYSLPKPATALGITLTREGISARQVIIASSDDRIFSIERRILEPRRPVGEVKKTEKEEGLIQYSELIPINSFQSLSYDLTIQSVKKILSSPTDLESQSLILAYGGPDLFFTRTSPSKGFDLLPEGFNKVLLSMVVIALIGVLAVTKKMATSKAVNQEWI